MAMLPPLLRLVQANARAIADRAADEHRAATTRLLQERARLQQRLDEALAALKERDQVRLHAPGRVCVCVREREMGGGSLGTVFPQAMVG